MPAADGTPKPCHCHADALYASLVRCPSCKHNSYDPPDIGCERKACGYTGPLPAEQMALEVSC